MHTPPEENMDRCAAPCRGARRLLTIAVSATALLVSAMAADLCLRHVDQTDNASAWIRTMALSAPALWTAGSPVRHPETLHPGVDLRLGAGLVTAP